MKSYSQTDFALGSEVTLTIVSYLNTAAIEAVFKHLWIIIFNFELSFSRFLPASELSVFNRNAGTKQVISSSFRELLVSAKAMAEFTEGLYNPFVLPALQKAGYSHSLLKGHEKDISDDHSNKSVATIDQLIIKDDCASIPYGTAIDLGGIGKGYLAEGLAHQVKGDLSGFWFSLGGDIVAGGTNDESKPWQIEIESAAKVAGKNKFAGKVILPGSENYAIATSGTIKRHGSHRGKHWHHIIDPRTQNPAETDILMATVCSQSAMQADVLASCAVILGSKKAGVFLKEHGIDNALFQCNGIGDSKLIKHFGSNIKLAG